MWISVRKFVSLIDNFGRRSLVLAQTFGLIHIFYWHHFGIEISGDCEHFRSEESKIYFACFFYSVRMEREKFKIEMGMAGSIFEPLSPNLGKSDIFRRSTNDIIIICGNFHYYKSYHKRTQAIRPGVKESLT